MEEKYIQQFKKGAYEMILPLLIVTGGGVPHLRPAVGAVDQAGKQAVFACPRPAVPLLPNLLHLVEHFLLNDGRVGAVEHRLLFKRRLPLLLVPDGVLKLTVQPVYSRRSKIWTTVFVFQ